MPTPRQHSETLACRPPVGPHGSTWLVRPYPRRQILELVSTREDRREADNTAVGESARRNKRRTMQFPASKPDGFPWRSYSDGDSPGF
jgi:hypothetical protein